MALLVGSMSWAFRVFVEQRAQPYGCIDSIPRNDPCATDEVVCMPHGWKPHAIPAKFDLAERVDDYMRGVERLYTFAAARSERCNARSAFQY